MAYIKKQPNGKYLVRWREGGGSKGRQQSTTFPTMTSARRFKNAVEEAGERWPEATRPDVPTFAEWSATFLATLTGIDERTRSDYARDIARHVTPTFGKMRLSEIESDDVSRWVRKLEASKMSAKTLRGKHSLLSQALAKAVKEKLVAANVARGVTLPRVATQSDESCFLTAAEFALIRSSIKADSRDFITALVGTGMRWGEATALEVRHVMLDYVGGPRVVVEQAWKRIPGNGVALGMPKTRASRRTISLDATTAAAFARAVEGKSKRQLVFTSPHGDALNHGHFRARRWLPAIEKATEQGLTKTPRVHDLRHTHASWLIQAVPAVPLAKIQKRLGHTSITTTVDRYGHLEADDDLGIHTAMQAALDVA